jgi:DNA-binding beta-propeller fold protein YncE
MKKHFLALVIAFSALTGASTVQAQSIYEPYSFGTLAGLALNSGSTDDTGSLARFNQPWGLAVDGTNNVYVADTLNHTIRKIAPGGIVTTLAGVAGSPGFANGPANAAQFSRPTGVAVNSAGTVVYVADYGNHLIRQISGGAVTTLAGSFGVSGTNDGTGASARFHNPFGVALNSAGTVVYVTDQNNQTIRMITVPGGVVTTLAGSPGVAGSTDGANSVARFNTPRGIAVDSAGNLYVADSGNFTVRKILSGGGVSTLAGSVFTAGFTDGPGSGALFSLLSGNSPFGGPCGVAVDGGGNVYVTDQGNHTIRKITPGGSVTTLAGSVGVSGSADGTGIAARFNYPGGVAVDSVGKLYVADTSNHTIRTNVIAPPPQIIVRGLSVTILNGDTTPTGGDNTAFFDVAVCGAASVTHTFTILNYGTASLNVTGIASSNPAEFLVGAPTFPIVIPGGGSWSTFSVTFHPNGPGPRTSTISIANNDSTANPYTFVVGGNGTGSANLVLTCATNKTVNCGAAWSFDPPAVTDSCNGTNVTLTVLSTVTTGVCPQAITRTWQATDAFGTNTCSQTVTLLDTTPPVMICPTNTIIVALDKNCQLEIPTIQPAASDNCTPASQLTYTQIPPAGTIVPGPCYSVLVTVTDACSNSTKCQIQVCGRDETPPTLIYPKSVTVTNCLVPNVLALVSASDNCTASNQLVFTQSPPAGTPIAAGGNQVSVTVTDLNGNATTVVIPLTSGGTHSFLDVMFNTAVDSNKAVLPYVYPTGSVDPHYTLGPVPVGTPTGPGYYNAPNAIAFPIVLGLPPFTSSAWIVPGGEWAFVIYPPGFYTYTNQFVLPPGMDPLTASISGRWAADDSATMYLNGLAPANQVSSMAPIGYNHWTYFTVNSGFLAFPAINKLYFVVTNTPIVPPDNTALTALRVEFTDASINCSICTPPAILQKTLDQSLPLNSTAVFSVSVWGTPPLTPQWYHNGLPLTNGVHYPNGVTNTTLTITPLGYADAGIYTVAVSNSCGGTASVPAKLTITRGWPWPWAWWNFSRLDKPFAATVGPDLILEGTNIFGFSFGTTLEFGLPIFGAQTGSGEPAPSANVMYVPPNLPSNTFIQLPLPELLGSDSASNYTLIMDFYVPSNPTAPVTLCTIFDRWGNLIMTAAPDAAGEGITVTITPGNLIGTPFNLVSSVPLQLGAWNRVAVVVSTIAFVSPSLSTSSDAVVFTGYVNGQPAVYPTGVSQGGAYVSGGTQPLVHVITTDGTDAEVYVSSIAFFGNAMTPEMIAEIGDPNNGSIPVNDPSLSEKSPVLSVNMSPNGIDLTWDETNGGAFFLEGTSDLTSGGWKELMLPFSQMEKNGNISTTANAIPSLEGRVQFYRLHRYIGTITLVK